MQIQFNLSDTELTHFSQGAKNRLTEQAKQYTLEIISEANKLETLSLGLITLLNKYRYQFNKPLD